MCDVYTWFIVQSSKRQKDVGRTKVFVRTLGCAVFGEQGWGDLDFSSSFRKLQILWDEEIVMFLKSTSICKEHTNTNTAGFIRQKKTTNYWPWSSSINMMIIIMMKILPVLPRALAGPLSTLTTIFGYLGVGSHKNTRYE